MAKYCMDCKNFVGGDCERASKEYEDVVWGREVYHFKARDTRRDEGKCGEAAHWFVPIDTTPWWRRLIAWLS